MVGDRKALVVQDVLSMVVRPSTARYQGLGLQGTIQARIDMLMDISAARAGELCEARQRNSTRLCWSARIGVLV